MLKNAQNRVFGGLEANYNQDSIFDPKGGGVPILSLMPSTIEEVRNEHMAAFMATSGSGEVSQAASVE